MHANQHTNESEDTRLKEREKSIKAILSRFRLHSKPFSISIVQEELRKWNENAYMPKSISIGPRHKGITRRDLAQMDNIKWHCMLSLLHRPEDKAGPNLEKCSILISELEKEVAASYTADIKLEKGDLLDIMLCDACFLLELLIVGSENLNEKLGSRLSPSGPGSEVVKKEEMLTDLLVLENQIPLVLLRELCKKLFPEGFKDKDGRDVPVETLALSLFGYLPDSRFTSGRYASHLLELVHSYISWKSEKKLEENQESQSQHDGSIAINIESPHAQLSRCATILEAAGVKIIPRGKPSNHPILDQGGTARAAFNFNIIFSGGILKIPPLPITKETEVRWRNLIAWEQGHTGFGCKHNCTWAAFLFNGLLCRESDVQLLKDRQVIIDHTKKSNKQLLEFFRSMVKGVDRGKINDSRYWEMVNDLNKYPATSYAKEFLMKLWHSWLPKVIPKIVKYLQRGYNSFLAALSILIINVQTYYAIVTYYDPKN